MMAGLMIEKKQAVRWTVGKGTRALAQHVNPNKDLVIVTGTTLADKNQLHVVELNRIDHVFESKSIFSVDCELWSNQFISAQNNLYHLLAATRRGEKSCLEIFSVPKLESQAGLNNESATYPTNSDLSLDSTESLQVSSPVLEVRKHPSSSNSSSQYLYVTETDFGIVDTGESLTLATKQSQDNKRTHSHTSDRYIGGDWITENVVFITSSTGIEIFDIRSNSSVSNIVMKKVIQSTADSKTMWLPPHVPLLKSACSDKKDAILCGGEDGSLRAIDIRAANSIWHTEKGHNHWVSVLSAFPNGGFLSGAVDGVVQCWDDTGENTATFPQHDDCVTNAVCNSDGFVTVSYNGRMAWNEIAYTT